MHEFINSDIFPFLSFIIGILGVLISIYSVFQGKRKYCQPCYAKMTKCILSGDNRNKFEKLSLKYNGNDIDQLSITTFAFWNKGKKRLKSEDYGKEAPSVKVNGRILDYRVRCVNYDQFFELNPKNNINNLSFEFTKEIGFNQGFVVDIIHTAGSDKDVVFDAKFNEIKVKRNLILEKSKSDIINELTRISVYIVALIVMMLCLFLSIYQCDIFSIIFYSLITIMTIKGISTTIKEILFPYNGVLKDFREYFGEIDK